MATLLPLTGRATLQAAVAREIAKGHHTLLLGPAGIGKTALLRALAEEQRQLGGRVVYVEQATPTKPMLLELAGQLHESYGGLPYEPLPLSQRARAQLEQGQPLAWRDLNKPLSRMLLKDLTDIILKSPQTEPCLI